jgi:hypothetical protein
VRKTRTADRVLVVVAVFGVVALFSAAKGEFVKAMAEAELCAPLCLSPRLAAD